MKRNLFIVMVLAGVVTVGMSLWWRSAGHRLKQTLTETKKTTQPSSFILTPVNLSTMKTVEIQLTNDTAFFPATAAKASLVQIIVSDDFAYETRLQAIHALTTRLNERDWQALREFLLQPDGLDRAQVGQVIKNELLDVLCALYPPPPDLGDTLIQMYRDRSQNGVIRDYAVQHLSAYYDQLEDSAADQQIKQTVRNTLWEAVDETGDSIAGTALLGLKRLSDNDATIDRNRIATTAAQLADDPTAGELTHITAYQICAQMGVTNVLPLIVQAAQTGETLPLRISAIGALGRLGGSGQTNLLDELTQSGEPRIQPVAQQALAQIAFRQNHLSAQRQLNP